MSAQMEETIRLVDPVDPEPVFEGTYLRVKGEQFKCRDKVPQWSLMKLAKAYRSSDPMDTLIGLYDFINALVLPEELERVDNTLQFLDIEQDDLDDAIGDALAEIAGRPKAPSSPSSTGSSTTEDSSQGVSLSEAALAGPSKQEEPVRPATMSLTG